MPNYCDWQVCRDNGLPKGIDLDQVEMNFNAYLGFPFIPSVPCDVSELVHVTLKNLRKPTQLHLTGKDPLKQMDRVYEYVSSLRDRNPDNLRKLILHTSFPMEALYHGAFHALVWSLDEIRVNIYGHNDAAHQKYMHQHNIHLEDTTPFATIKELGKLGAVVDARHHRVNNIITAVLHLHPDGIGTRIQFTNALRRLHHLGVRSVLVIDPCYCTKSDFGFESMLRINLEWSWFSHCCERLVHPDYPIHHPMEIRLLRGCAKSGRKLPMNLLYRIISWFERKVTGRKSCRRHVSIGNDGLSGIWYCIKPSHRHGQCTCAIPQLRCPEFTL